MKNTEELTAEPLFEEILATITNHQTIIIHRHQKPDPDAIGSQVGLAELLRHNFPSKRVLVTGQDEPTLTWLATMDAVTDADYEGALVIVTDTANLERIDDDRYDQGAMLIKLDHHPNDQPYGDLCLVDTTASSASEMVTDLALTMDLALPLSAVRLLYTGIVGDTGRFLYPNATAKTFSIAGELRSYDLDFALLMRQMDSLPAKVAKLMGYILDQLTIDETGAAHVLLTTELLNRYDVTPNEVSLVVGTPGKIDTVESWAIFTQQDSGHYRVNLRSKSVGINDLAKEHDGGGHPLASGAWAYSEDEIQVIWNKLTQLVAHKKNA